MRILHLDLTGIKEGGCSGDSLAQGVLNPLFATFRVPGTVYLIQCLLLAECRLLNDHPMVVQLGFGQKVFYFQAQVGLGLLNYRAMAFQRIINPYSLQN